MAIDMSGNDPGSKAAANITKIIEAAANAKTAQVELQKHVMLSKIDQQQELQTNKAKLSQGVQSNIDQKNANINWLASLNNPTSGSPAEGGAPNNVQGVADAGTPASMGAPSMDAMSMSPAAPQPAPQAPAPMTMANSAMQQQNNAQSQMSMAPRPAAPMATPPPSVQYQGLGYQPMEANQVVAMRQKNGQTINVADRAYVGALQKVKAGTASQAEVDMVNKMNNKDGKSTDSQTVPPTNLEVQPTSAMTKVQAGLRNMEKMQGLPPGSLWMNPSTGDAELSPLAKTKLEAQQRWSVEAPDRYGKMAEQDLMHVFSMRSGALGVQDAKINQAMHVKQLFDQSVDPKTGIYNLKAPQFAEATQALAVLVSNSNQTSEGQRQEIKQRTMAGDFNGALTYAFGIPKNATSQQIADMYVKAVDRQGLTAQTIKEKDISDIKNLDSFRQLSKVDPERADNLYKANFGIDYRDFISKPLAERIKTVTGESPTEDGSAAGGKGTNKLYGGLSISDARAQGYTGFDTDKQQWVK